MPHCPRLRCVPGAAVRLGRGDPRVPEGRATASSPAGAGGGSCPRCLPSEGAGPPVLALTWKVGLEAGEQGMSKGYRRGWTAPLLSPRCGRDQPEMEAHCRPGAGCSLPLGLLIPGYASEGLRPDVSDLCDSLSNLCPWRWRAGDCWLQTRKRACGGGRGRARLRCFRMFLRNLRPEADVRPSCLGGRGDRSQGGDFPGLCGS